MFALLKSTIAKAWRIALPVAAFSICAPPAISGPFFFSTGDPDGRIATASRPAASGKIEIESADDFLLTAGLTTLTNATFTGLIPVGSTVGSSITDVVVEIYRVFPKDSVNPPSGNVPTRVNSPSDVAFDTRDSAGGQLSFSTSVLNPSFTVANSVLNGINPLPNQTTGGEGPVTGQEVLFSLSFITPFSLPADHYFFIPQVSLDNGDFLWLSAPKPIVAPGTPFSPDLQSWTRNANIDPNWLRIGTDIVGSSSTGPAPTFNAAFSLIGQVPEPATLLLLAAGLIVLWWGLKKRKP
jgi:PEP-CTERM motif